MNRVLMHSLIMITAMLASGLLLAQDSAITYQGQLRQSGQPFNGTANLEFRLYDQLTEGSQVGAIEVRNNWPVSDGLFQVELDFGAGVFSAAARFLEVRVDGTALTPRQAVRPAPVALFALDGNEGPEGPQGPPGPEGASPFSVNDSTGAIEYLSNSQVIRFEPDADPSYAPAIVLGHAGNQATGRGAVAISGGSAGRTNIASGLSATVSGGWGNKSEGDWAVVSGGNSNTASAIYATVAGGGLNTASDAQATVSGGQGNLASDFAATVAGGHSNSANGIYSVVGGGRSNEASELSTTVAGGQDNVAAGEYATIGGGQSNIANNAHATIGGGLENQTDGEYASVAGGESNRAEDAHATVGGGDHNVAKAPWASISGGLLNLAEGSSASIGGGANNSATQQLATVVGGWSNTASGNAATVGGGVGICAGGAYSWAAGRRAKVRPGTDSGFAGSGCHDLTGSGTPTGDAGTFVWADSTNADFISTGPDQFLVRAGGGVGINTNAPAMPLHVMGTSPVTVFDGQLRLQSNELTGAAETGAAISLAGHDGIIPRVWGAIRSVKENDTVGNSRSVMRFYTRVLAGTLSERMRIDSNGVTYNASGSWATFSDRRLKEDIAPIDQALDQVLALNGVHYRYRDPERSFGGEGPRMGFVAQEVEEVFPQWVGEDVDGYKFINATGFEALMVEALRELLQRQENANGELEQRLATQAEKLGQVDELLAVNQALVERNRLLESRLAALEQRFSTNIHTMTGEQQ
jgi:trimeric autotransporter adhesin